MKLILVPLLSLSIGYTCSQEKAHIKDVLEASTHQEERLISFITPDKKNELSSTTLLKFAKPVSKALLYPKKVMRHLGKESFEEVTFQAREDEKSDNYIERKGILRISPEAKATVLMCHGFMCNKFDIGFLRFIFSNYNVFSFDLRGHGELAENQCCTFGYNEKFEVQAAAEFLKGHPRLKNQPIIAYGFSMGAVAAARAQAENSNLFTAMILDCPFDSSDNLIERALEQVKFNLFGYEVSLPGSSLLKSYAYTPYLQAMLKYFFKAITKLDATQVNTCIYPVDTLKAVREIKIPLMIIGCINDEKVPLAALYNIYEAVGSTTKKMWVTKGDRHYDSVFRDPERYKAEVTSWLTKVLNKTLIKELKQKVYYDDPAWHKLLLKTKTLPIDI